MFREIKAPEPCDVDAALADDDADLARYLFDCQTPADTRAEEADWSHYWAAVAWREGNEVAHLAKTERARLMARGVEAREELDDAESARATMDAAAER